MTAATMIIRCPVVLCRRENPYGTELCAGCRTPLSGYARLHTYPAYLFNQGLALAREGHLTAARDCFAAVVLWCPTDTEARNALALAALHLGDPLEAHRHWTESLSRKPGDPKATRGLARLAEFAGAGEGGERGGPGEPAGSGKSAEAAGPAEPDIPGVLEGPGAPEEPAEAPEPSEAPEPAEAPELGEVAKPGEPAESIASAEPSEPAAREEPAQSAESGRRGQAVEPVGGGGDGDGPGVSGRCSGSG